MTAPSDTTANPWELFGEQARIRVTDTGRSSLQLGACEVCNKHCASVFHLVEERLSHDPDDGPFWHQYKTLSVWGHDQCIRERFVALATQKDT